MKSSEHSTEHTCTSFWGTLDVHCLWELVKDGTYPLIKVDLSSLRDLDEWLWEDRMSTRTFIQHVERVQEADISYPVIFEEVYGNFEVLDGMHRICKLILQGQTTVQGYLIPSSDLKHLCKTSL